MRAIVLVLGIVLASALGHADEPADVEAARKAIEAANAKFGEVVQRRGDAAAFAALYTADCYLLPPDQAMIRGADETGKFWAETVEGGLKAVTLRVVDLERRGDVAVETGSFALTMQPEGKPPVESAGKYVVVWKQQRDGSWKMHRDVWNGAPAPR